MRSVRFRRIIVVACAALSLSSCASWYKGNYHVVGSKIFPPGTPTTGRLRVTLPVNWPSSCGSPLNVAVPRRNSGVVDIILSSTLAGHIRIKIDDPGDIDPLQLQLSQAPSTCTATLTGPDGQQTNLISLISSFVPRLASEELPFRFGQPSDPSSSSRTVVLQAGMRLRVISPQLFGYITKPGKSQKGWGTNPPSEAIYNVSDKDGCLTLSPEEEALQLDQPQNAQVPSELNDVISFIESSNGQKIVTRYRNAPARLKDTEEGAAQVFSIINGPWSLPPCNGRRAIVLRLPSRLPLLEGAAESKVLIEEVPALLLEPTSSAALNLAAETKLNDCSPANCFLFVAQTMPLPEILIYVNGEMEWVELGSRVQDIAGQVTLSGASVSDLPVRSAMPNSLSLSRLTLAGDRKLVRGRLDQIRALPLLPGDSLSW